MVRFLRLLRCLRSSKPPAAASSASNEGVDHSRGDTSEPAADLSLMLANFVGGFKSLPLEIVDEIIEYLADDRPALRACSLTCKALFRSSRPIAHRKLFVVGLGGSHAKDEQDEQAANLVRFRKLLDATECGLTRYARELTIRMGKKFEPENLQPFLPQFQTFARLTSLALHNFNPTPFLPVFEQYFGHLAQQIRSFKFLYPSGPRNDMIYFISRFPNLDDLRFYSFPRRHPPNSEESSVHSIQSSPTLRGTLQVANITPGGDDFLGCLTRLPSGLRFRSIEFHRCTGIDPNIVIRECSSTIQHLTHITHVGEFSPQMQLVRP